MIPPDTKGEVWKLWNSEAMVVVLDRPAFHGSAAMMLTVHCLVVESGDGSLDDGKIIQVAWPFNSLWTQVL
jgi:hypothetical protein